MIDSKSGGGERFDISQSVSQASQQPLPSTPPLSLSIPQNPFSPLRSSKGENEEERIGSVEGIREDSLRVIQFYYFSVSAGE